MKKENQGGITLIALVITIIVLLILAGISIVMLTGENGLLKRASEAGVIAKIADSKEQVALAVNDLVEEYYQEKYTNTTLATPITESTGEYVATRLKAQLAKEEYKDYAQADEYDSDAKTTKVTLKVQDKDGKNLEATYDAATGKLSPYTAVTAPSGS